MKATLPLVLAAALIAPGCSKEESHAPAADSPTGSTAVPSQAELDQKAAREISASNADQELEKLQAEIEKDR
jgi:hypothetical protein